MKKNNALRVAAGLVVAVLLSTCLVSGTYAKYTTKAGASDEARVAKWGVTVTGNAGAFSNEYSSDTDGYDDATVKSVDDAAVVAPGTGGTFAANSISGAPEVAVHVENSAIVTLSNWSIDGADYYCPLVVTVGTGADKVELKGVDYASSDLFKKAIEDAVKDTSDDYAPNADITAACKSISWKWDFNGDGDKQTDAKDTKLGDRAANNQAAEIHIELTTTVTQLD